nr:putative clathrin assembly protein At5g35200 [Tanacetum cinerariifolium]
MSVGGSQNSLRKALGAIKDSTTVNLAKVNSDYKRLDVSIVKATNHVECPPKEKHVRVIFAAISATRSRGDVAYCIQALARRLSKTRNWAVALKTLIVIHRALREVDLTFQEELLSYGTKTLFNLSHFKDDSSPKAWDYSSWIRTYALYLEERLNCFHVLKYDVETERIRTRDLDTPELFGQLSALQQLLYRVLGCGPQGASVHNFVIQLAFTMVASESVKIYKAVSEGTQTFVDKFFEMKRYDAVIAMDIYKRAGMQAGRLSEFYKMCNSIDIGRGNEFITIEQPSSSFIQAMEEYLEDAPRAPAVCKDLLVDGEPKETVATEHQKDAEVQRNHQSSSPAKPEPQPEPVKVEARLAESLPDLLDLEDPLQTVSQIDQKNATAMATIPIFDGNAGWELALVSAPSSNEIATVSSKLAGGLDKRTLDSLYDDAVRRTNQSMAAMAQQQQAYILQQQQQQQQQQQMMMISPLMPQQGSNPFGNPFEASPSLNPHPYKSGVPLQPSNQYTDLL